jgi:antitoxin component YwqK of YwqJK toxin-antitoxin module
MKKHSGIKVYTKYKFNKLFMVQLAVVLCLSACHRRQPPQQQANGTNDKNDSVLIHPVVDPNAKEGLNIIKYPNGVIKARGYFDGGKKTGEWQAFYPDGMLWSDEAFTNGYPDGPVTVYYDEYGKKMYEGRYRMGKPIGNWRYYKQSGELMRTANYDKQAPNTAL